MHEDIDYFALERHEQNEGSFNAAVKDLVAAIRYTRQRIPATEVKDHMPAIFELEKKLHGIDDLFEQPHREYVQEIWDLFDNQPQPDETKSYSVFELVIKENNGVTFLATGNSFSEHIIAEEWIKESGDKGNKYVILEVIEP
jgi:hypothetical protein